ncbi:hypothetical protein ACFVT6_19660 [Streptomyces sp. NPDC058049]|uniref:hypothetical protein n=1 Tax=Streptomyces sp. NPDC058049 TaxID=3346314 RepID=UPI0036E47E4F
MLLVTYRGPVRETEAPVFLKSGIFGAGREEHRRLNLRFLAPTADILEKALRIQELDWHMARAWPRTIDKPGARELNDLRDRAREEQARSDAGEPCDTEAREALDAVLELRREQDRAEDAGEFAPDVSSLRATLVEREVMWEEDADRLLSSAAERRMARTESRRMNAEGLAERRAAGADRDKVYAELVELMAAWRKTPPK